MESSKEDLIRLLSEKGLRNFEVDVSPDFLSIGVTLHNNQKIHHLNIHAHYNDWLYMWSIDASQIIACYWEIIGSHYLNIDDLIENLLSAILCRLVEKTDEIVIEKDDSAQDGLVIYRISFQNFNTLISNIFECKEGE